MDLLSSKWRKLKGRPTAKKKRLQIARAAKKLDSKVSEPTLVHEEANLKSNPQTVAGRTRQKFDRFQKPQQPATTGEDYVMITLSALQSLVNGAKCKICNSEDLHVDLKDKNGFAFNIAVVCKNCEQNLSTTSSSPRLPSSGSIRPPFEINRRMSDAFVRIGQGHTSMVKFGSILGMKVLDQSSFRNHLLKLCEESNSLKKEVLARSCAAVREHHESL